MLLAFLYALSVTGCASVREGIPFVGEAQRARNEGYSLLYELASKESDVDKILILKQASAPVTTEVKAIAEAFHRCQEQLEAFAKRDSGLRLYEPELPPLEKKTRGAIEKSTTKRLLFSSGKDFERELWLRAG